jgi:predicted nucleotidyltransferase
VHDYKEAFGPDLLGVVLYGSGARGEYVPKKSDINFMIILTEEGINRLGKTIPLVSKWHKRRVSTPLFLTKEYIESSLDTFPIEFLNFRTAYRLIYGEDVLKDLAFDRKLVRLQCERELKGKLLQLRENFLETEGDKQKIRTLISLSLPTFFSIFQAVLFIKEKETIREKEQLITAISQETGLSKGHFVELTAIKEGRKKITSKESVAFMEKYIEEIRNLSIFVDQMEVF